MTIAFNSTTESGFIKADFDQISAYLSGADDSTTLETRLDGLDTTDGNLNTAINTSYNNSKDELGEIKMFDLSRTNAVTKATLQSRGWAICDGTTPASQGISDATITTTPDLRERFLRHSANETTGGTGGANSKTLIVDNIPAHTHKYYKGSSTNPGSAIQYGASGSSALTTSSIGSGTAFDNQPAYYDICYFIKVKVI